MLPIIIRLPSVHIVLWSRLTIRDLGGNDRHVITCMTLTGDSDGTGLVAIEPLLSGLTA